LVLGSLEERITDACLFNALDVIVENCDILVDFTLEAWESRKIESIDFFGGQLSTDSVE